MYTKFATKQFKKSAKKIVSSGMIKRSEIELVVEKLAKGEKLSEKYKDHKLSGEYEGYRDCHIKPDILLIYKIEKKALILILADIGNHSNLF